MGLMRAQAAGPVHAPRLARPRVWPAAVLAGLLGVAMHRLGFFEPGVLSRGIPNVLVFLGEFFPPQVARPLTLAGTLLETIEMSFVGTSLGALAAVPVAVLAARNLSRGPAVAPVRGLLGLVRSIPALLWGVLFVAAVGLGPTAGTLALAVYTFGYLGKLFYETLEGVDPEVVEAVRGAGASRLQVVRHAVLPESANQMLSQVLFMFEYNVRASAVLGFVGAGGVGFFMMQYLQTFQYGRLAGVILVTVAAVLVIDAASARIRSAFLLDRRGRG